MIQSSTFFQQYTFTRLTPSVIRDEISQKYRIICESIKQHCNMLVRQGIVNKDSVDMFFGITSTFAFFLLFVSPNTVSEYEYITCSYLLSAFHGWPEDMTKENFKQLLRQISELPEDTATYEYLMKDPKFERAVAEFGALLYASNGPKAKLSVKERLMNNKFIVKCRVFG